MSHTNKTRKDCKPPGQHVHVRDSSERVPTLKAVVKYKWLTSVPGPCCRRHHHQKNSREVIEHRNAASNLKLNRQVLRPSKKGPPWPGTDENLSVHTTGSTNCHQKIMYGRMNTYPSMWRGVPHQGAVVYSTIVLLHMICDTLSHYTVG